VYNITIVVGMNLLTARSDLEDFNKRFYEITKDLFVRSGSLFRVREDALQRWGVGVTDENREWLKERSQFYYTKDVEDLEYHPEIKDFLDTRERRSTESTFGTFMAATVNELLKSFEEGSQVAIADIPCRGGDVSAAIANELWSSEDTMGFLDSTTFYLVDYNHEKLGYAKRQIGRYQVNQDTSPRLDDDFLAKKENKGKFDVIVSLLHLHHKSFSEYLDLLYDALKDDGVLLIGDWHSTLWDHPTNICRFLDSVGEHRASSEIVRIISSVDPLLMQPDKKVGLTLQEQKANEDHENNIREVYEKMRFSQLVRKPRIHMLGAHRTSEAQKKDLEASGFTLDNDKIKAAFPKSNLVRTPYKIKNNSDFAVFMIAKKVKRSVTG
jgi:SAM-dependent methyltransferase